MNRVVNDENLDMMKQCLSIGFDEEAAAVLIARLAILKIVNKKEVDKVVGWCDKTLINFVSLLLFVLS